VKGLHQDEPSLKQYVKALRPHGQKPPGLCPHPGRPFDHVSRVLLRPLASCLQLCASSVYGQRHVRIGGGPQSRGSASGPCLGRLPLSHGMVMAPALLIAPSPSLRCRSGSPSFHRLFPRRPSPTRST
jgi:hypothetical protein